MGLLDRIRVEETNQRRPSPVRVEVSTERQSDLQHLTAFGYQDHYQLTLGVFVKFWANQAQYRTERRIAERVLLHTLYGDALARIDRAMYEISDGDTQGALATLSALRTELVE